MQKYHRIFIDEVAYYREFIYGTGLRGELLSEDELVQQLFD